jgi:hypothetical protein
MKHLFLACSLFASSAFAGGMAPTLSLPATSTTLGQQQQQQQSADAAATNAGNNQNITIEAAQPLSKTETVVSGTQTIKNVPSVNGPALTSSNDTCMGSSSGSVNAPGIGLSIGSTWVDNNCRMLKNSRELWNMGMRAAALALMCSDDANKHALEITGYKCPSADAKIVADGDLNEFPPTGAGK